MKNRAVFVVVFFFVLLAAASRAMAESPSLPNEFYAMDTAGGSSDLLKELGYTGLGGTLNGNAKAVLDKVAELDSKQLKLHALYVACTLSKTELTADAALDATMAGLKGRDCVIWLHISSKDFKPSAAEGDDVAVKGLKAIADRAAAANLRVAIYPHLGNWAERAQDGVRLAKKVARPNFGVSFNLCHCLAVGDEEKVLDIVADARPYLFMVTINGADSKGKGWEKLIQSLGKGSYDPVPLLRKLHELGYSGADRFSGLCDQRRSPRDFDGDNDGVEKIFGRSRAKKLDHNALEKYNITIHAVRMPTPRNSPQ